MTIDDKGLDLIKRHEGMRNHPYLCPANVPTIGYGTTFYPDGTKVTLNDKPITIFEATQMLKTVLAQFESKMRDLVHKELTQNQWNALISFAYNVGLQNFKSSTLLKRINNDPCDEDIRYQFSRWNKARVNGVLTPLKGLTRRRKEEAELYFED